MGKLAKAMILASCLGLSACIQSANEGWDFGGEPGEEGEPLMVQAWRGVHGGRIGFRCRAQQVLLFVESWHPLPVPAGRRVPMRMSFSFDVASGYQGSIDGLATSRGIEFPAPAIGEGAENTLLRGLHDGADELLVSMDGAVHRISILFDIENAGHAHRHVAGGCANPLSKT